MKKCIPCGTEAVSEAHTCANCGEGSWSISIDVAQPEPTEIDKFAEPVASSSEHSFDSTDPETAIEVPSRRRRNR